MTSPTVLSAASSSRVTTKICVPPSRALEMRFCAAVSCSGSPVMPCAATRIPKSHARSRSLSINTLTCSLLIGCRQFLHSTMTTVDTGPKGSNVSQAMLKADFCAELFRFFAGALQHGSELAQNRVSLPFNFMDDFTVLGFVVCAAIPCIESQPGLYKLTEGVNVRHPQQASRFSMNMLGMDQSSPVAK
jgi:hypothetical protein